MRGEAPSPTAHTGRAARAQAQLSARVQAHSPVDGPAVLPAPRRKRRAA